MSTECPASLGEPKSYPDVTPRALRERWRAAGYYDDKNLYAAFKDQALAAPDHVAIIDDDQRVTYGDLLESVHRLANLLSFHSIGTGDVVAVQLPNSWMSCALDFAVAAVGAVCMPFPAHYRHREVTQLVQNSAAVAYVGPREYNGHDYVAMVDEMRPALPTLGTVFVDRAHADGLVSLEDAVNGSFPATWEPRSIDPDSGCRVFVTSGTESAPKMVLYSHRAVGVPFQAMQVDMTIDSSARMFPGVPLGSGMGVQVCALLSRHGGTVVLSPAFKADEALRIIEQHRVTHFYGVPTMVQMMLKHPDYGNRDLSSLNTVIAAGSSLPASLARHLREDLGWGTISFYGCSDGVSINTGLDLPVEKAAVTVGRSDERISVVKIVGEDGLESPRGTPGEIWGRGPFAPMCYLNRPELDARYRSPDGWVKTGDLGVMDDEGLVSIVGRVKDVIIRGGFNISPQEVDDLIAGHPDVVTASCVGAPDERLGERVCAFVVLREGAEPMTVETLGQYLVAQGLSKYKLPEQLEVRTELPTSPVGKILKRVLRDQLADVSA